MTHRPPNGTLDGAVARGHYAKKQLLSASRIFAWSHRERFALALELVRAERARRVLDFGCGDGTFLALLQGSDERRAERRDRIVGVGAEVSDDLVGDCRARLGDVPGLSFVRTDALDAPHHLAAYDCVTCMEVLEHVVDVEAALDRMVRCLEPGGALIVSVPVEIGPALLIKQTARTVAGWRGLGDYPGTSPYRWRDLVRGLFAGRLEYMERPIHRNADRVFHDHKGFNWKALRERIARRVDVERQLTSPVRWLPPGLASQVWLVARQHGRTGGPEDGSYGGRGGRGGR